MQNYRARTAELRRGANNARNAALAEFDADPLAPQKIKSLLEAYTQARHRLRMTRAELIPEILSILSLEERKQLLHMRQSSRRWRHRSQQPDAR